MRIARYPISHLLRSDIFLPLANVLGPSSLLQRQDRFLPPPITGLSGKAKSLKNDNNKNNKLVTVAIKFLAFSGACFTLEMIAVEGGALMMGHMRLLEEGNLLLLLSLSSRIIRKCRWVSFSSPYGRLLKMAPSDTG